MAFVKFRCCCLWLALGFWGHSYCYSLCRSARGSAPSWGCCGGGARWGRSCINRHRQQHLVDDLSIALQQQGRWEIASGAKELVGTRRWSPRCTAHREHCSANRLAAAQQKGQQGGTHRISAATPTLAAACMHAYATLTPQMGTSGTSRRAVLPTACREMPMPPVLPRCTVRDSVFPCGCAENSTTATVTLLHGSNHHCG